MKIFNMIFCLSLPLAIGGCTPPIMGEVNSAGIQQAKFTSYFILDDADELGSLQIRQKTAQHIHELMQDKGAAPAENLQDAAQIVHYSYSVRPGQYNIVHQDAANSRATKGRKLGLFDKKCEFYQHRLIIEIIDQKNGELQYRGEASEQHCDDNIEKNITILTNMAMSDFGAPKGKRISSRKK
ncbi:DUF4136 domain-containing protein [Sphingorhabdus lutea]|nr:DUF4136 domain-containing protein [Sphingorhabdus lutea]